MKFNILKILFASVIALGLVSCGEQPTSKPTSEPTSESTSEPTSESTSESTSKPTSESTSELDLYFLGKWYCTDSEYSNTWFILNDDYTIFLYIEDDYINLTYEYLPADGKHRDELSGGVYAEYYNTLDWISIIYNEQIIAMIYIVDEFTCIWEKLGGKERIFVKIY